MVQRSLAPGLLLLVSLHALQATAGVRIPDWVHSAAATKLPSYPEKTRGVALLDETIVTASASGEIRSTRRVVYRILGTSGRDLGAIAVPFGGDSKLKRLAAWSIAASGKQSQAGERDAIETTAFDGELYADQKIKVLRAPAAEPGSVVAYEIEMTSKPYGLQDVWRFQSSVPVRRARYVVTLPAGWEYETHWVNASAAQPQRSGTTVVWELADVAAIDDERGAPAAEAVSGYMGVSFIPASGAGHRTWDDVARWYDGLAEPRRALSPAIEAKAKSLTTGAATQWEKVLALAKFAQRDVRYVAIEIGIGGYQPHAADAILATLYGDCKDKVTVLAAMLRAVGIDSHYVLVNSERGVVDEKFPSLYGFNHAIIAIEVPEGAPKVLYAASKGLLFFDPTHPYIPLGLLPPSLQGSRGLVVATGRGELVALPLHPPAASQLLRSAKLRLNADGSLEGEVSEVRTGAIAAAFRASITGLGEKARREYIDRTLAYHFDQHTIQELAIENADDPSKDLVVRYAVTAPKYARNAAGMLLVRPRVIGTKPDGTLDLAERRQPYLTAGPEQHIDDVEIALPAGLAADELPQPRNVSTAAVTYSSASAFEKSTLHYRRRYEVHQYLVPREKLAELNKAFAEILADERSSAVLK